MQSKYAKKFIVNAAVNAVIECNELKNTFWPMVLTPFNMVSLRFAQHSNSKLIAKAFPYDAAPVSFVFIPSPITADESITLYALAPTIDE